MLLLQKKCLGFQVPLVEGVLSLKDLLTLDVSVVRAGCFTSFSPAGLYASRAFSLAFFFPYIGLVHIIVRLYDMRLHGKKGTNALFNTAGLAFNSVYVHREHAIVTVACLSQGYKRSLIHFVQFVILLRPSFTFDQ